MAHAYELWPEAVSELGSATAGEWHDAEQGAEVEGQPTRDLGWLGLVLCFGSAVLTLVGIGSALERIFS